MLLASLHVRIDFLGSAHLDSVYILAIMPKGEHGPKVRDIGRNFVRAFQRLNSAVYLTTYIMVQGSENGFPRCPTMQMTISSTIAW